MDIATYYKNKYNKVIKRHYLIVRFSCTIIDILVPNNDLDYTVMKPCGNKVLGKNATTIVK